MTKYIPLLISNLIGITAMNGCGKSTSLDDDLLGGKMESLPSCFTASHNVKEGKVLESILYGNGMYILFQDLNNDGKLGLQDYCSVNEFKPCAESPYWGVAQSNNKAQCVVNVCATHYPHSLSTLHPTSVKPVDSSDQQLQGYTTQELKNVRSIKPMTTVEIENCPKVCATYFGGSQVLLFDGSVTRVN